MPSRPSLAALATLAAPLVLLPGTAMAACAAPTITVAPDVVAPGQVLVVTGQYFADGCSDTGGPPSPPSRGISVFFAQPAAGAPTPMGLGAVDAGVDYAFRIEVTVPASALPGPATLTASAPSHHPVSTSVVVQSSGELPRTGPALTGAAVAALLAVVTGACLTWR